MKNLLIALLSVAVIVLAFLLWNKSKQEAENSSTFIFTNADKEKLDKIEFENMNSIGLDTGKIMVKSWVDSLAKFRGKLKNPISWKKDSIERYVFFKIGELNKMIMKYQGELPIDKLGLRVYFGHYQDTSVIRDYLKKELPDAKDEDLKRDYLNRNTIILQLTKYNGDIIPGASMNVGSICPPKCSKPEDEYYPIK